jgi:hypothetical protein
MAASNSRVAFADPYPYAAVGTTGYELQIQAAMPTPKGTGYLAFVAVWNGRVLLTRDDVAITNPDACRAFVKEVAAALKGVIPTAAARREWLGACTTAAASLQAAYQERQRELEAEHEPKATQATQLVDLAQAAASLFHTPDQEPYATFEVARHRETWPLKSRGFRLWLARLWHEHAHASIGSQAVQDALDMLGSRARFDGPEHPVFVRLAALDDVLYLDLADADWRVVRIAADGWRLDPDPPVRFRRPRGMLALPAPRPGGSVDELRPFTNPASDDDWKLRLAWLIATFHPSGPYPVLILSGEQGSGKSDAQKALRRVVDPNLADLRTAPRDERDLFIAANNGRVVGYDNLSTLPPWLSDGLCRIASGGGLGTRELYSDTDETLIAATRPILFNGIEELAVRGDLLDRAIVQVPPVLDDAQRQDETVFWRQFATALPGMLGALLTTVAACLKNLPTTTLGTTPRMADFARWSVAAEQALEWQKGDFLRIYTANQAQAAGAVLESSPLVAPLRQVLDDATGGVWEGTASELLRALEAELDESTLKATQRPHSGWPRSARWCGCSAQASWSTWTRGRTSVCVPRLSSRPTSSGWPTWSGPAAATCSANRRSPGPLARR